VDFNFVMSDTAAQGLGMRIVDTIIQPTQQQLPQPKGEEKRDRGTGTQARMGGSDPQG